MSSSRDRTENIVRSVWRDIRPSTLGHVDRLGELAAVLQVDPLDEVQQAEFHRLTHHLIGNLGTFGLHRGTELARQIDELVSASPADHQHTAERLAELVSALRMVCEQDAGDDPAVAAGAADGEVLIVSQDAAVVDDLVAELSSRGRGARPVPGVAEAHKVIQPGSTALVLVDLDHNPQQVRRLLRELRRSRPVVPAVVLTSSPQLSERVVAARAGVAAFMSKQLSVPDIAEAIEQVLHRVQAPEGRVLLVDDDPAILRVVAAVLQAEGLDVIILGNPTQLWDKLDEAAPDLLILDLDMPVARGTDLCRALRADPRWATLPVVFLTASADAATVEEIFAAGADDFVAKPVVGPELLTRVRNRLERVRMYREQFDTDAVTGLRSRAKSEEELVRLISTAAQLNEPLALAVIDLDRFKLVNDRYGHATGDEVLRQFGNLLRGSFRDDDIVARWGGEEFLVALYGADRHAAAARITVALADWRSTPLTAPDGTEFTSSFSAGVAEVTAEWPDVATLYRAADAALYQAKENGRGQVVAAQ